MALSSSLLRLSRPRRFLHYMSLTTGANLITLSLLLNKVSGLYGIIALFTGYHLSLVQLSMYIYSIAALIIATILARHICTQSPFHCLLLSCFYVLDSVINAAYTAAFAVTWFVLITQPNNTSFGPGSTTMSETSGFINTDNTNVDPSTTSQASTLHSAIFLTNPPFPSTFWSRESLNSLGLIITLSTIRVYLCLIMLSFARLTLQTHIIRSSQKPTLNSSIYTTASPSSNLIENPFATHRPEGQGWKGQVGRFLISLSPRYWLGSEEGEDNGWTVGGVDAKSRSAGRRSEEAGNPMMAGKMAGPNERERRRRSGTGPMAVPVELLESAGGKV